MMQQIFVFLPRSGKYQWTENNTKSFSTNLKLYQRIYPAYAEDFMPIIWNVYLLIRLIICVCIHVKTDKYCFYMGNIAGCQVNM